MRKIELLMDSWAFSRDLVTWESVKLPHTWNVKDGTDGKNDYYRGTCYYARYLQKPALGSGEQLWLEITGAAMTALEPLPHCSAFSRARISSVFS